MENNTYYLVARAYAASNESFDSNEIKYKVIVNSAPMSDAGTDQAVSSGTQGTLGGTGSTDSDGTIVIHKWMQTSGPVVSLSSLTSNQATFTAPSVAESSDLNFQLTVTDDGGLTNSDTCQVTVLPVAPADSDGDGLTDAEEIDVYGTDLYNSGSESDDVSGVQEVSRGTDSSSKEIFYNSEAYGCAERNFFLRCIGATEFLMPIIIPACSSENSAADFSVLTSCSSGFFIPESIDGSVGAFISFKNQWVKKYEGKNI